MAYMDKSRKAKIVANLKPILKKYGVKGTLSVRNHSTIVLNVKSGKVDFIGNFNKVVGARPGGFRLGSPAETYVDVNPYWFHEHYDGVAREFLTEAFQALKSADWYDESNAQVDYFDIAYYVDINVGKWNQPYVVTE
jgi:hypothetical protein